MSNKLFGSYIGIVIDAVDPEHLGRVQVFIPSLDCNLISSFTGQSSYIFPGNDTGGDLSIRDLNLLKKSCVWAYTSQPIFGGSSIGRVNESTGKTTVSDSVTDTEAFSISENGEAPKAFGAKFSYYGARHDAFAIPSNTLTQKVILLEKIIFQKIILTLLKVHFLYLMLVPEYLSLLLAELKIKR